MSDITLLLTYTLAKRYTKSMSRKAGEVFTPMPYLAIVYDRICGRCDPNPCKKFTEYKGAYTLIYELIVSFLY
jgi:hypothetical protein